MEISISSSLTLLPLSSSSSKPPPPPSSLSLSSFTSINSSSSSLFSLKIRTSRCSSSNGFSSCTSQRPRKGLTCNALFGLGVPELVVIAGVAALVFGPKKLPEVGKSIGKTVKSFQQAAKEFESELKKEPDSLSDPSAEQPKAVSQEKEDDKAPTSKESV